MSDKAKLIWDFRGPAAQQTAAHHLIHLKEFFEAEDFESSDLGVETNSEMWHSAYAIVAMETVNELRSILKPHRGQRVDNIS